MQFVVEMLIEEGKIFAHDVARYLHIVELEERLAKLRGGAVTVPQVRGSKNPSKPKSPKSPKSSKISKRAKRPKRTISAKGRKSYRLQGRYIASIRRFSKSGRAKYQKIAKERGREKAIAAMLKDLAG